MSAVTMVERLEPLACYQALKARDVVTEKAHDEGIARARASFYGQSPAAGEVPV